MTSQKETGAIDVSEGQIKQNDNPQSTATSANELKDVDKLKETKSQGPVDFAAIPSNAGPSTVPVSPIPNLLYANGTTTPAYMEATAAEAYQAAIAAGYDPSDPNAVAYYGMHQQYQPYYPEYPTGYPGTPPTQTSPSLPPQPLSPYFTATSPTIAYYPTSPQVGPTGIIHSPPMHPYLYSPQSPYSMHAIHTLSPTLSHTSSSAPNSPPPQYLPGPGVPSPKVGPLGTNNNNRGNSSNRAHQQYNYNRRNSGSHQAPNMPNFHNPTKTTNIYIRGLPPTTTDESLHSMCSIYGTITSSKAIIDQKQGDCKGYGSVMYETEEQAKHAIEQLTRLGLQVSFAKVGYESFSTRLKNLQDLASTNIYLSNLPLDMNEQQLEDLFKPYKVVSNRILRDNNNTSRGVGFARMEDRDSALAIIHKFNGYQLPGANLPLQVRFADSLAQKKLKGTARKRMWRAREFASLGGTLIPQVPVTPEHMLGMAAPGSPPGPGYIPYYAEGVQPTTAYPPGSLSPTFGPQYPRYYQPMYAAPTAAVQPGAEGHPPTVVPAPLHGQPRPYAYPEGAAANAVPTENQSKESNAAGSAISNNNDPSEELSDLVQKLSVDSGKDSNGEKISSEKQ